MPSEVEYFFMPPICASEMSAVFLSFCSITLLYILKSSLQTPNIFSLTETNYPLNHLRIHLPLNNLIHDVDINEEDLADR